MNRGQGTNSGSQNADNVQQLMLGQMKYQTAQWLGDSIQVLVILLTVQRHAL